MYKLIAIDLDDTLLDDNREISAGTQEALTKAVDQGVIITLATGRMYASASAIAGKLALNVPLITYQGAFVKNLLDGKVLYERYVPVDIAKEIYAYSLENGLHVQGYVNDQLYVREENERTIAYGRQSSIPYIVEPNMAQLMEKPQPKLLIYDEPEKLDTIAEEFRARFGTRAFITKSKPYFLEITHPEGTKGQALRYLADYFGCNMSETIAIGDSWNDHDMVEAAGLGVAMGNAVDSLKQIADYITASNEEEGVKQVIEKFIFA